jgi:hypothetical protein
MRASAPACASTGVGVMRGRAALLLGGFLYADQADFAEAIQRVFRKSGCRFCDQKYAQVIV